MDAKSFLFSLTNPGGKPERLMSWNSRDDLYYGITSGCSACFGQFGGTFRISDSTAKTNLSWISPRTPMFAKPKGQGNYPMTGSGMYYFTVAEIVAFTVPS